MKTIASLLLTTAIFLSWSSTSVASIPGFCGTLDLTRTTNSDLENIIMLNDLTGGKRIKRGQCGLPGERLNICSACSETTSETAMRALRPMVGDPAHLAWHADWHELRGTVTPLDATSFAKAKAEKLVPSSWTYQDFNARYAVEGGNLSGENFFFMHRLMIKMVQLELAGNGLPCFAPWNDVPASVDDQKWPVPRPLKSSTAKQAAQAQLEAMRSLLAKFRSPKLLKNISLSRLGQLVEPRLHLQLHGFYRSTPACSPEAKAQGYCDDLVPVQTSPLNKHFWKIHGLVDQLVGDWLKANGYTEIAVKCEGRKGCYQWQGTWIGRYPRG